MKNLFFLIASTCAALFASAHAVVIDLRDADIAGNETASIVQDGYTIKITAYRVEAAESASENDGDGEEEEEEEDGGFEDEDEFEDDYGFDAFVSLTANSEADGGPYGDIPEFEKTGSLTSGPQGIGVNSGRNDVAGLDGSGSQEALFFQIIDNATGKVLDVEFTSIILSGSDSDVGVFAGSTADDLDWVFNGGFDDDVPVEFAAGEVVASALMIAAPGQGDSFFVQSISFDPIPVPGALPLMAAGLGAFGFTRKKRRS